MVRPRRGGDTKPAQNMDLDKLIEAIDDEIYCSSGNVNDSTSWWDGPEVRWTGGENESDRLKRVIRALIVDYCKMSKYEWLRDKGMM